MQESVCYLNLRPAEFRKRLAERPVGYLPLGTLEWHGEQNPLGSDALISQGLFERAARQLGGIVFPPIFLGPDRCRLESSGTMLQGMDYAVETTPARQLDGSCYWISEELFIQICESILEQAKRVGFKCMIADGHGPSRRIWGRCADMWEQRFGLKLVSVARDFSADWCSQRDHAARNETSLMITLHPDLVDLSQLSVDRSVWPQGISGEDPRDSTSAYGEECLAKCISLLDTKLKSLSL